MKTIPSFQRGNLFFLILRYNLFLQKLNVGEKEWMSLFAWKISEFGITQKWMRSLKEREQANPLEAESNSIKLFFWRCRHSLKPFFLLLPLLNSSGGREFQSIPRLKLSGIFLSFSLVLYFWRMKYEFWRNYYNSNLYLVFHY